ncbi:hypothetical protein BDV12DRAFT_203192 [Aspergillus spectabilis]
MKTTLFYTLLSVGIRAASAQVKGTAFGFATGTTGGGSATPATPSSLAQLKQWITDNTPRTILINRTWDFAGSEGTTTGQCCSTRTTTCSGGTSAGQASIQDTCTDGTWITCTYDNAARSPLDVGSNKSIVGVGSAGVLKGKGLRVRGGNKNIIIQNIHITNLNPQYISLIGRQMIVSGWGKGGHVTISNNEFDGRTSWSSGCNGKHYWTLLLLGSEDWYTFSNNYIHDVSGRAPHLGTDYTNSRIFFHAVNNYFQNVGGHAFDIDTNTWSLLEGNYFNTVTTPLTPNSLTSGAQIYDVPTVESASNCVAQLGYICEWNRLSNSGTWTARTDSAVLSQAAGYKPYLIGHIGVADVPSSVVANAGVGKV